MGEALYAAIFVERWPWWAGGIAIGLLVPLLLYFHHTPLGVSTGYASIIRAVAPGLRLSYFRSATFAAGRWDWRVFFVLGMVLGAGAAARLMGLPLLTTTMGVFTAQVAWPFWAQGAVFFLGGLLLALGARIAGGCTSGHGIFGLANLRLASLVTMVFFMGFGALSTYLVTVTLLGGGR